MILSTPCDTIREEPSCMTPNNYAWVRRHSIHTQPQPLSVQGFGYRYRRSWGHLASQNADFEQRRRVTMVAGRPSPSNFFEAEGRKGAIINKNRACFEALRRETQGIRTPHRRLSHVLISILCLVWVFLLLLFSFRF